MTAPYQPPPRSWLKKFADALAGIAAGMRGECSFHVHLPVAAAVIAAAIYFRVTHIEACLLALCITAVLSAELMNSALERLSKAITPDYNDHLRLALNIASGAVLLIALGAVIVGVMIFWPYVMEMWQTAAD